MIGLSSPRSTCSQVHPDPFRYSYVQYSLLRHDYVYLAALENLHIESGCPLDLLAMPVLHKSLRGIKLSHGNARRLATRLPHQFSIASKYTKLNLFSLPNVDSFMLWAAFTLSFFGFLRSSEFTCNGNFDPQSHLARTDISFHPNILHPTSFDTAI